MNITFDLETLGKLNAPIVQLGAVKFTDGGEVTDEFIREIKLSSLTRYGFEVDFETVGWWMGQDDKAIKSVFCTGNGVDIRLALLEFTNWLGKAGNYSYWSHATFDPPILNYNYQRVGLKNPIPFVLHRDIRTITHFTGKLDVERVGVHHNALDDCRYQAAYISKGIRIIKGLE